MVKSLRLLKIRWMVKSLRLLKIKRMVKSLRLLKIRRMVKSLRLDKKNQADWESLVGVEISAPSEILAELEKQAAHLLLRLSGISNC